MVKKIYLLKVRQIMILCMKIYKFLNNLKTFMIFWSKFSKKWHFLTLMPIFSKLNFSHIFGYSELENGPIHPKIGIKHPQGII